MNEKHDDGMETPLTDAAMLKEEHCYEQLRECGWPPFDDSGWQFARSQERRAILAERRLVEMRGILEKCKNVLRSIEIMERYMGENGKRDLAQSASTWLYPGDAVAMIPDHPKLESALQAAEGLLLESPKDNLDPQSPKPPHGTAEGSLAS